jgi:hypothetical protein
MPPLTCPSPEPPVSEPDCPLYAQRLTYSSYEALRRAVLAERPGPSLAALIRAEPMRDIGPIHVETVEAEPLQLQPPALQPALPAPESVRWPIFNSSHKEKEIR